MNKQNYLKKKQNISFIPSKQSKNKKIINIFKIITYLQNTISIHPISSNLKYNIIPKNKLNINNSNKISFLNKNPFFNLFHLFHKQKKKKYTLHHKSKKKFQKITNLFTLSITKPNLIYHKKFTFSINSYKLNQKQFLKKIFNFKNKSKKKSLLILPPIFYKKNKSFYQKLKKI